MKILVAALLYFAIVFGTGFAVGPWRVLYVEPHVGTTVGVLIEAPILIVAMLVGAKCALRWSGITKSSSALLLVGVVALALQQIADIAVGGLLRGMTVGDHVRHFATTPGMIYGALLMVFLFAPSFLGGGATSR